MGTLDYAASPAELPPVTLVELFLEAVDRFGTSPAFSFPGPDLQWLPISYDEAFRRVKALSGGLSELGLVRGDAAAILSSNRPEWALADYACLCSGIEDVPIYSTLTPPQIAYILNDSGAKLVFAEDPEQLAKLLAIRSQVPDVRHFVVFDPPPDRPPGVVTWEELLEGGADRSANTTDDAFREDALSARPDSVATILYTSGTTGDPKGVLLTHNNIGSNVLACREVLAVSSDDVTLSFLPLSHVLQRMVDYLLLSEGCTIAYARDIQSVAEDLKLVRPTIVVSVPRLYEKVYNKVMEAEGIKAKLVHWAVRVGLEHADHVLAGRTPGAVLRLKRALADALVFTKIREGVGGRLRYFVSGGAPLAPDINKFFYAAGLTILEGYGLSETSPVTNVSSLEDFKIGSVGKPVPGTEIRIAADGEILVRGPQVMKGYFNKPELTAEAMAPEGWFRTGDIGELDEEGFLRITDRKKDIIVTAGGKNIAPQPIENRLKANPFIDQAVMIGDRRNFPSLLVVPAFESVEAWARTQGIASRTRRDLLDDPRCQEFLGGQVHGALAGLARFEAPKKIAFLETEFTVEGGTLTPTQKVKRRIVEKRYAELIESFYEEANLERDYYVG